MNQTQLSLQPIQYFHFNLIQIEKLITYSFFLSKNLFCKDITSLYLLSDSLSTPNVPTKPINLNYFKFISERLLHHHCNEPPPMLSVTEFMQSLNKNQLCIKIVVQKDEFIHQNYQFGCHIHFDNNSIRITDCTVSPANYFFIREGKTETGQEIKLFWGEQHFELLKDTEPCTATITEFETLRQQIDNDRLA